MAHYTRLKDLREDHDLTQNQLVEILGIHKKDCRKQYR